MKTFERKDYALNRLLNERPHRKRVHHKPRLGFTKNKATV